MSGKQHLALGATLGLTTACILYKDIPHAAAFTGICTTASVFPDIDVKNSIIAKKLKISSAVTRIFLKHRSVTHTALFGALTCWLLNLIMSKYIFWDAYLTCAWGLGYFIHLLQDTFTSKGIKWLFPLYMRPITFSGKRKSSNFRNTVVSVALYIIGTAILITYLGIV